MNAAGDLETWVKDTTSYVHSPKLAWAKAGASNLNTKVYTTSARANNVIRRLFIDLSGYTGSVSLDGLQIQILSRGTRGLWGIMISNSKKELVCAPWMNRESSVLETTVSGLYVYAEFNWDGMFPDSPEEDTRIYYCKLTEEAFAPYNDPRQTIGSSKLADGSVLSSKLSDDSVVSSKICTGAVTSSKIASGAVTGDKLSADVNTASTVMTGKLYGTAGDSITAGSGLDDSLDDSDPYAPISGNKKATYGYYIAKLNRMRWANYGIGGSTLADVTSEGRSHAGFSKENGRYTQMADDLDYLSIWFGWNDNAYGPVMKREEWLLETYGTKIYWPSSSEKIGTVAADGTPYASQEQHDACNAVTGQVGEVQYDNNAEYFRALYVGTPSDNTNKTFWGAWNMILPYLINKYPFAKILLIVPYLYDGALIRQCVRDVAAKYGLQTYDFANGSNQLFFDTDDAEEKATGRINGTAVTTYRKSRLLADNVHPNDDGYRYLYPSINARLQQL